MKYIKLYLRENINDNPTELESNMDSIQYNIGEQFLTIYTDTTNYIYPLVSLIKMDKCKVKEQNI